MADERPAAASLESIEPAPPRRRALRRRLALRGEFILALAPTLTILGVLGFVEALTEQRLLFASLASSAFLIYMDPGHGTNAVRTLVLAHVLGAGIGWAGYALLGSGYLSAGSAMIAVIALMIVLDAVHPPAVATTLAFALRAGDASNLLLFVLALGVTASLVVLERLAIWLLARSEQHGVPSPHSPSPGR